jgi:hypothetical protein
LGADDDIVFASITKTGKFGALTSFAHADFVRNDRRHKEVTAAIKRYHAVQPGGRPAIGFAVSKKAPAWSANIGEFSIAMPVRSIGTAGVGLRVHLSGEALSAANQISFRELRVATNSAAFVAQPDGSMVADIPDFTIPVGMTFPFDPKPKNPQQEAAAVQMLAETEFDLSLVGSTSFPVAPLLTVSVSVSESLGPAPKPSLGSLYIEGPPLKWIRSLTIS